jgi:hypothetical protein
VPAGEEKDEPAPSHQADDGSREHPPAASPGLHAYLRSASGNTRTGLPPASRSRKTPGGNGSPALPREAYVSRVSMELRTRAAAQTGAPGGKRSDSR